MENVLEILLDAFRLGCGRLVHTFPPHAYFAWEEEKERGEVVLMLNHPQDRRTVQPRTGLRLYIRPRNPTGSFDLLVAVVAP